MDAPTKKPLTRGTNRFNTGLFRPRVVADVEIVGTELPCPGKGVGWPNPHDALHLKHHSVGLICGAGPHQHKLFLTIVLGIAEISARRYKLLAVLAKRPSNCGWTCDHGFTVKPPFCQVIGWGE